ncbi:MAG TPA: XRE family transcriptional regulator [Mycobacterium sp.]|nr:XRE family transcriptional regulator [Mycobacterium sp.]
MKLVARRWREVRAEVVGQGQPAPGVTSNGHTPDPRRGMFGAVRARCLAELRKIHGHARQCDIADLMGVSRPRVSKLESGDLSRTELGTLQSYVAALGGNLRVVADFGESSVELGA